MSDPCCGDTKRCGGCVAEPPFNAPRSTQADQDAVSRVPVCPNAQKRSQGREWKIPLPYPRPPLSMNDRMHWAPRNRLTQQIKSDVHTLARLHKLPTGLQRVIVTLHWQPTTNRRRDVDNPSPTLKAAVDGLVAYGLTPDDNSAHVWSATVIEPRAANASVWLTIEEAA